MSEYVNHASPLSSSLNKRAASTWRRTDSPLQTFSRSMVVSVIYTHFICHHKAESPSITNLKLNLKMAACFSSSFLYRFHWMDVIGNEGIIDLPANWTWLGCFNQKCTLKLLINILLDAGLSIWFRQDIGEHSRVRIVVLFLPAGKQKS